MQQHGIALKIQNYLEASNHGPPGMSEAIIEAAGERFKAALRKRFVEPPRDPKRISLSSVGKPLCQTMMAQAGVPQESPGYQHAVKMLLGEFTDCLLPAIIEAAGIKIKEAQTKVTLKVGDEGVNGSLDLVLTTDEDRVWDAKSASKFGFSKFEAGYDALKKSDGFGYLPQIYGYSVARGIKPGGFLVLCKDTGDICECPVPDAGQESKEALDKIADTISAVKSGKPFQRCFEAEDETFYKRPTGKKVLGFSCSYCPYKFNCWPGLEYRVNEESKAKNPSYKYYVPNEVMQ